MKFSKIFADAAAKVRERRIKHKTAARLEKYRHSPRLKLSRLYGYKMVDEKAERIPEEARVVLKVFMLFTQGKSAEQIKATLDEQDIRTRLGNRWTVAQVMGLVRPIYAGLVPKSSGGFGFVASSVYPPILSQETYRAAQKALKRQVEAAEIDPITALLGGRNEIQGRGKVN